MKLLKFAAFLYLCHIASGERWSRQLSANVPLVNDWVPIAHDKTGKAITFGNDLTPAAQTQQFQFFTEPLNNRFNLQQQHPAHPSHPAAAPSEINSFIQNSPPPAFQFVNQPQKQRTVQTFGGPINNKPIAEPLIQNPPPPPFQFMQEVQRTPQVHHYQSQPIPKGLSSFTQHPAVSSFQSIQQPHQSRIPHFQKLPTLPPFQQIPPNQQAQAESEQLLYVPFESLYAQNQPQQQQPPLHSQTTIFGNEKQQNRFNILNQPVSASLINDFYSQNEVQELPAPRKPITTRPPTIAPATSSYRLTTPFETVTKLKPHQPPLAMFVANDEVKGQVSEADVLNTLKNSNTIDVMDSVDTNAPKVFIGPSGMDAPTGYSKFELPYLSSIDGTRNDRKIDQLPFFVAPLSYKTPPGFSKIPLPAPHVGSIVVNQPPNSIENNESKSFTPDTYYTKQPQQLISTSLSNTRNNNNNFNKLEDSSLKKNTQTVKLTSGFHLGSNGNVQLFSNDFAFPTIATLPTTPQPKFINTTPRPTFIQNSVTPTTPLTKVKASVVQEHYSTLTPQPPAPRSTISPGPTKNNILYDFRNTQADFFSSARSTQRQLPVTTTQQPIFELNEHKTVNEEYFKVNRGQPSISSNFEYEFESKQQKPKKDFSFKPIPEFNFDSITTTTTPTTTRKPKTKSTSREIITTTVATPAVESHRSAAADYSLFPSSTPYTQSFEYTPTVSIIENTDTFRQTYSGDFFSEFRSTPRPTSQNYVVDIDEINSKHRLNGDGHSQHDFFQQEPHISATDSPNYNLPSELPQISAQLPGLINSLMDDKWMQTNNITDAEEASTTTSTTTTTRRPNTRGRRPVQASSTAARQSTAEPNYSERKPATRTRQQRPSTYSSRSSLASTEATFPSRSTPTRSSKIKYNITSEDQSRFRTRNRRPVQKKEEENIEYQRDVLNQNYPSSVRPPVAGSEQIIESVHIENDAAEAQAAVNDYNTPLESVEVIPLGGNVYNPNIIEPQYLPDNPLYYENTIDTTSSTSTTTTTTSTTTSSPIPSTQKLHRNHKYSTEQEQPPALLPQHKTVSHRLKGNFNFNRNIDSFYNVKSQDSSQNVATENSSQDDNQEIFAVPSSTTTSTTTTTEAPETEAPVTRRTNFPRRRLYTTTESTVAETDATEPSYASRTSSRGRKENVVVVKKVRSRGRTTTEAPETTRRSAAVRNRASYNTNSRNVYRERSQINSENNEEIKPRFRIRENTSRFRLDTQESQWSSRLNQNTFQPIDEEKSKAFHSQEVNDDQEIVTAAPENENDSYLVNVSASVVPTKNKQAIEADESSNIISTTEREEDIIKKDDEDTSAKDVTDDEKDSKSEKKATKIDKKGGSRRGVWRKIKVRPADGFETAETQNIGKHLFNSVTDNDKKENEKKPSNDETTLTVNSEVISTIKPAAAIEIATTILPEPTETRMFDDARKAFVEFLSSEDDSDDGVNMEEADDRLERDSTTTLIIPATEEVTTTTLPATTASKVTEIETAKPRVTKDKKQVKTSTSQRVTGEICFRGRCIKTDEK